ncbi:hypothetical protein [Microbacterium sp. oral taxon 186]|jgi:hypothetical protein|uniref:hypothetical protein n=1 Tax=Microbacterium sp. oral taxon 186 TaxID=712383 RepID=UPI00039EAC5D|nr:hypothetical protein [Microbacterium sp. oral taxon 186]
MDLLAQPLDDLRSQVVDVLRAAVSNRVFERGTERELARQITAIAEIVRFVEALLIDATGEAMRRSEHLVRDERMTSHLGCRDVTELLQTLTRLEPRSAARLQRAATAVRRAVSPTTGEALDAPFPSVRAAMVDGVVGTDGILAITGPLQQTAPRVSADARREAADLVVAEARGEGPDAAPPACAELLRIHAQTWALALDQDGAEPRERIAERKRSVVLGVATAGGVPIRGTLLPEVAAQLQTIFDAQLFPAVAFDDPITAADAPLIVRDERTRPQKSTPTISSPARASPTRRAAISLSARWSPATSPARVRSSASSPAQTVASSRSAPRSACSTGTSVAPSPFATAAASSPAAACPPAGARSTMSPSMPEAARHTPTTASCWAHAARGTARRAAACGVAVGMLVPPPLPRPHRLAAGHEQRGARG